MLKDYLSLYYEARQRGMPEPFCTPLMLRQIGHIMLIGASKQAA
jgi:hypothetical protein